MSSTVYSFGALPFFPGSKKRLIPLIFALVAQVFPASARGDAIFADPFLGSGTVALAAKRIGFGQVLAADIAERSTIVGRAVIENATIRLTPRDVLGLLAPVALPDGPMPELMRVLMPGARTIVERAWAHLSLAPPGVRRDLLTTLFIDIVIRAFPLSMPGASDARHAAADDFDRVSSARLPHYMRAERRLMQANTWLDLASAINRVIGPGEARVVTGDALELLPGWSGDLVVLDPPYGRTSGYEAMFRLVDECLGAPALGLNAFSGRHPPLDELLDAASGFRHLILTYGNALLSERQLLELVARHRKVERVVAIPYRHYGALATEVKNRENREFMVLASERGGA